jgi:asparagine synthase (glutamine-hydrolysing)
VATIDILCAMPSVGILACLVDTIPAAEGGNPLQLVATSAWSRSSAFSPRSSDAGIPAASRESPSRARRSFGSLGSAQRRCATLGASMCGISLVLDHAASPDALEILARMHAPIAHRGPDGEGFLVASHRMSCHAVFDTIPRDGGTRVAAAFRRLNILDLTEAASQPMLSPSRPIAILFNGEIYNFRELRDELSREGRAFRSSGDTEVVLGAYERWGADCFGRFEGMWAIVIVDLERRQLVLSRDRFGIKPLFWTIDGTRLLLASEAKQIIAATGDARANRPLLGMFLRGVRFPMLEETFFEGIRAMPPATWCEVPIDGDAIEPPQFRRYWDLGALSADATEPPPYSEAVDRFESLLCDAVSAHRIADVRVGSLLSGGLDSSTLAVMLSEFDDEGGRRFPTYSFGFRERDPEVCEMPYVDAVVKHRGLTNYETTFDAAWVRENAGRVIYALEEPLLGIPPMAQYRVLQLARERGTTVLFDGQGADEIFAGYPYHQRIFLSDRWRRRRFGDFVSELHAMKTREGRSPLAYFVREMMLPAIGNRLHMNRNKAPSWVEPSWLKRDDSEFLAAMNDRGRDSSLVNRQVHFDIRWGNAKTILGYGDRNGMAHSLEVRVPFFDRRLVELAMTLPDHYKIGNGDRKRILRDVARRRLPAKVTERPDRIGFAVPTAKWMRNGLRSSVQETLTDASFAASACFRRDAMERFVADYQSGKSDDVHAVWRLHSLAIWKSEFGVTL